MAISVGLSPTSGYSLCSSFGPRQAAPGTPWTTLECTQILLAVTSRSFNAHLWQGFKEPVAHLVGCYNDESGHGLEISNLVLAKLSQSRLSIELHLFCCGPLNTGPAGQPLATSLAFDTRTGAISQGLSLSIQLCTPSSMSAMYILRKCS